MLVRSRKNVSWTIAVLLLAVSIVSAQTRGGLTENSYQRARQVLDAAIKAHGGGANFDDISLKLTGMLFARNQSPNANVVQPLPIDATLVVDARNNRIFWEPKTSFPGGFDVYNRVLVKGDQANVFIHTSKHVVLLPSAAAPRETITSRFPQLLLARAAERAATLRWLGEAEFEGKKQNVIAFAAASGNLFTLYLDARTNLLTKYETLGVDPVAGDAVTENILTGYTSIGGFQVPSEQIQKIAGEPSQDYRYSEIKINSHPADSLWDAPTGYAEAPATPNVPLGVRKLADDVYLVEGLGGGTHAAMFVAFKDYVMVFESPLNEAASRTVLDKVKETVPGKPVRYVTATHHHSDHIGGVRTYFAEGVTLVTTPGNVAYFERMAVAPNTIQPDALSRNPRKPVIETIQGKKRVFTDGARSVELIDIGPNPHVDEMVIAWLPKEKILFVGDLFGRNPDNTIAPATAAQIHFAEALRKLGLPVETLVDVHSRVNTMADLQKSLDLTKRASLE